MSGTAIVIVTDQGYFFKAKRTILDIRTRGKWDRDVILISVGFNAPKNFLDFYSVIPRRVEHIDTSGIEAAYKEYPLKTPEGDRHVKMLSQWDKLYVFEEWFAQWKKIIFFDAGLRIFEPIDVLDRIPCEGLLMAPDDAAANDAQKRFHLMLELDANPPAATALFEEYPREILQRRYFLNCIWVYDTAILKTVTMGELVETMNKYPICRCNEMTIMNLLITMKYGLWKSFPEYACNGKRLFGWTERDRDYGNDKTWRDFCFLKYPRTINRECE